MTGWFGSKSAPNSKASARTADSGTYYAASASPSKANSAKGKTYDSQGQARSASPLVRDQICTSALTGRNWVASISALQASISFLGYSPWGDVGALPAALTGSYFSPV